MNIPVLTYSGHVVVRPDQTYRHGQDTFYVPEGIGTISWSPALFLHVCKPGRYVGAKFAERYFDGSGLGILLYPEDFIGESEESYASAICLSNTTYFPDFAKQTNIVYADSPTEEEYHKATIPQMDTICSSIEAITRICHIRTGDVIGIELGKRTILCTRQEGGATISSGGVQVSVIF